MYELTINAKNLYPDDSFSVVPKSRVVVENEQGEIIICQLDGKPTFPGGKIDKGESPEQAAVREVAEETGIVLDTKDLSFIFTLRYITDEYGSFYDGKEGALSNRINVTNFFYAHTNQSINLSNSNYTDSEIRYGFTPYFIDRNALINEMCTDHSKALNGYHFDIENRQVLIELGWL